MAYSAGLQLVNPSEAFKGSQGASELQGKLTRAQWNDWKTRFRPYVDKLGSFATDDMAGNAAATEAIGAVNQAYGNTSKALRLNDQGLGVTLSPAQKASRERQLSINQTASATNAANNARTGTQDLQQQVMAGGLSMAVIPDPYQ